MSKTRQEKAAFARQQRAKAGPNEGLEFAGPLPMGKSWDKYQSEMRQSVLGNPDGSSWQERPQRPNELTYLTVPLSRSKDRQIDETVPLSNASSMFDHPNTEVVVPGQDETQVSRDVKLAPKVSDPNSLEEIARKVSPANLFDTLFDTEEGILSPSNDDSWIWKDPSGGFHPLAEPLHSFMNHQENKKNAEAVYDREGVTFDPEYGVMVDTRKAEKKGQEDRGKARSRRESEGEDMWRPDSSYEENRQIYGPVPEGESWDDYIADSILPTEGYGRVKIDRGNPDAADAFSMVGEATDYTRDHIGSWREDEARAHADYKFRDQQGRVWDLPYLLDGLTEYSDARQNAWVTTEDPGDEYAPAFSGGHWYTKADVTNPDSETIQLDEFTADQLDENGVPDASSAGYVDYDQMVFVLNGGQEVPLYQNSNGDLIPAMTYAWDTPAENKEDARAWQTFDDFVLPNGDTLKFGDVNRLLTDPEAITNEQSNPLYKLSRDVEFDISNPAAMLNPENFIPAITDVALSSAPFMIPGLAPFSMAMPMYMAARYGVDPMSYDSETGTYADPGSLSESEYLGNLVSTFGNTVMEGLLGVGKIAKTAARSAGGDALRSLVPSIGRSEAEQAAKTLKQMNKGAPSRITRIAAEEGAEEAIANVLSQGQRGDLSLAYANPEKDESGNEVVNSEGKTVYDENTPQGQRVMNALHDIGNDFAIGAAFGGIVGAPAAMSQRSQDKKYLQATGGYIPGSGYDVTGDEMDAVQGYYDEYMRRKREEDAGTEQR